MSPAEVVGTCRNSQCTVDKGGRCLEGFDDVLRCPNFEARGSDTPERPAPATKDGITAETPSGVEGGIELPSGEIYQPGAVREITAARGGHLIVLAGAFKSGKTTLVTSIYQAFQQGGLDELLFAGSHTLFALERLCFPSMEESGLAEEETERTSSSEGLRYLHLSTRHRAFEDRVRDVLFLDASGEYFELAATSIENCRRLAVIRTCDHFVLFVNGERLDSLAERQGESIFARTLLRTCLAAGMLHGASFVDVLISKWDVVQLSGERETTEAFVADLEGWIGDLLLPRVGRLRFFHVSARPKRGSSLPPLHNLKEVFISWISESSSAAGKGAIPTPVVYSEFDAYLLRRRPSLLAELGGKP